MSTKYCRTCEKSKSPMDFRPGKGMCITCQQEKDRLRREGKKVNGHTIESIQNEVCRYFNIPRITMMSSTRKREIVQARQIAMFFSKNLTKESLATIGIQIGDKDHATVLHAFKTVNNLIDTDKRFRQQIDELEQILKSPKK